MTEQIPDSCTITGRQWEIEEYQGSLDCIPTSESLGFTTRMESSANWSGRIDHFLVHRNRLFLFKIRVNLDDSSAGVTPSGARLEEVTQHEPVTVYRDGPPTREYRLLRQRLFVFDDLTIPFTGAMRVSRPYFDPWNLPWPVQDGDWDPAEQRTLLFVRGFLASVIPNWPQMDLEPALEKAEDELRRELLSLMPNDLIVLTLWDWDIRFENHSFEDMLELTFTADEDYVNQETVSLFEDFLSWIDEMGMDFAQDQYSDGEFEEMIRDACSSFIKQWRKNVAGAFAARLAAL